MTRRALIVGATSMLGSRLCGLLRNEGWSVLTCGRDQNCDARMDLAGTSLPAFPDVRADVLFHCAASFGDDAPDACIRNELVNAVGCHAVAALAKHARCRHLVYAGTAFSDERGEMRMHSYGLSKKRGEEILAWSLTDTGMNFTSLRFSQLCDEHGKCCGHQKWYGRIVACAESGVDVRMPRSEGARNFLHVADAATLMSLAYSKDIPGVLPATSPESMTYEQMALTAHEVFGRGGRVLPAPEKAPFREIRFADAQVTYARLGFTPRISIRRGFEMILEAGTANLYGPRDVA